MLWVRISETLPKTGYIKMIDIWTIFALSYPFSVIALFSALEVQPPTIKLAP